MVLVLNSSPLIYLAKVGLIGLLGRLPEGKMVPGAVLHEVVEKGKERGAPDALVVERLIDQGVIKVRKIDNARSLQYFLGIPGLHEADAQILELAKELEATAVVDDEKARNVADASRITNRGTLYLLIRFRGLGLLSTNEVRHKLDEMIKLGWRCSTDVYAEAIRSLEAKG